MRDIDIRTALVAQVLTAHIEDTDTLVRHELGICVGRRRVDIAIINGEIAGWEIRATRTHSRACPDKSMPTDKCSTGPPSSPRPEALDELRQRQQARGLSSKARHYVWERLADVVPLEELRAT